MAAPSPLRVLICDDAVGFPSLVRMWLGQDPGMEAVAVVTTAAELLAGLEEEAARIGADALCPKAATPETLRRAVRG